jgi:hypothetical protein
MFVLTVFEDAEFDDEEGEDNELEYSPQDAELSLDEEAGDGW